MVFDRFFDFASLVFLDFAHNDTWACLVVFLRFAGPVNILLVFFVVDYAKIIELHIVHTWLRI